MIEKASALRMAGKSVPAPFFALQPIRNSFDFMFLTSPRDQRSDGWIGQPYELSYLNSEIGTNFVFRYKPFEISKGHLDGYTKSAERRMENKGIKLTNARSDRHMPNQDARILEGFKFSWKWVLNALGSRGFYSSLNEVSSIIEVFNLWATTTDEGHKLEGLNNAKRTEEEKINATLDRRGIRGMRRDDMRDILENLSGYRTTSVANQFDTIAHYYDLFSLSIDSAESIVIGKLIIGYMDTFKEGVDYNEFLRITGRSAKSGVDSSKFLLLSDRPIKEVYQINIQTMDKTEYIATIQQLVNADSMDYKEGKTNIDVVLVGPEEKLVIVANLVMANSVYKAGQEHSFVLTDKVQSDKSATKLSEVIAEKYDDKYGTLYEITHFDSINPKEARGYDEQSFLEKTIRSKESSIINSLLIDKQVKSKEFSLPETFFFDRYEKGARLDELNIRFETLPVEALPVSLNIVLELQTQEAIVNDFIELINKDTQRGIGDDFYEQVESMGSEGRIDKEILSTGKLDKGSMQEQQVVIVDSSRIDSRIDDVVVRGESLRSQNIIGLVSMDWTLVDSIPHVSDWIAEQVLVNSSGASSQIDVVNPGYHSLPKDVFELEELSIRTLKIKRESWIQFVLHSFTPMEKVVIIQQNWNSFVKFTQDGYHYNEQASNEIATMADKELKHGHEFDNVDKVEKNLKDVMTAGYLLADAEKLNGYLYEMMGIADGADSDKYWEATVEKLLNAEGADGLNREGLVPEHKLSPEQERHAFVRDMISAHDADQNSREAFIPKDSYILVSDGSDWEDIWNRYSPGVDILDPPDADFDYATLSSKVYNSLTGVPYRPLSPLNAADVKVHMPLHHPLPENFDLGIDDGKVLAVDNYIFIDMVLAIESLKNRNALRYAGMPAEKATRELFSKLYTWIQQAASSGEQYDRMFRFCRWYAESIVLQLSTHMLHRVYNVWRSRFHLSEDLDIPYTSQNWTYFSSSQVAQTTDVYAEYQFEKANFVDGEFILRGYFDNPRNEGTMKVLIDDKLVDTIQINGAFTRTYEVPQGSHTYQFIFEGASGRVSLSTLEISGCEFISAHTTSDDSDTNGLKASTLLINHLLSYFDKHHGGGKTKGTMEVKQRRVWNVQT